MHPRRKTKLRRTLHPENRLYYVKNEKFRNSVAILKMHGRKTARTKFSSDISNYFAELYEAFLS